MLRAWNNHVFTWLIALLAAPVAFAADDQADGFVANCTSNMDGTGLCVNAENGKKYTCLIIPGQVIDCKSPKSRSFQCVWISGVQAYYAEFWCDRNVDVMLRNEISSNVLNDRLGDQQPVPLKDRLIDNINSPEVNGDSFGAPIKQVFP